MSHGPANEPTGGDLPGERDSASGDRQAALAHRLAFLELTPADAQQLRALRPDYESFAAEFVERFYRHLLSFEATAGFFRDSALIERLKEAQREHFRSMLEARWDDEFVRRRHRVGHAHAAAGVEPQYFLGAWTQFLDAYLRHAGRDGGERSAGADPSPRIKSSEEERPADARLRGLPSVLKAVFLDVGLTLDAYFQQSTNDLRHALDMLWKANAELRRFAQFTSHDLKTPLATAANLCEEALDEFGGEMPEEARRLVDLARQTVFRMSRMIDELLSVTLAPVREPLEQDADSDEALAEAADRVRPLLEKRQIELRISGPLPRVRAHRVHLREAFYNLLANAARYMDQAPGRIEVAAEAGEGHCTFSIRDNGPGIPPEELLRVFAPFRRLPAHRHLPGSGLGLYFTRTLIEQHGGSVWVESTPGQGSCFYVRLERASD